MSVVAEPTTIVKLDPKLPTIAPPTPKNIHFRVIVQGEVDQVIPDNTDKEALARLIANDIKTKNPTFKITKLLMAHGYGPIGGL